MDEPEPVPTERVAPAITSRLLHEARLLDERDPPADDVVPAPLIPAPEAERPPIVVDHPIWIVTVAVGVGAMATFGDPRVAVAFAGIVGLAGLIRSADRRLPFSFGEGFVGYRADLGWPRGVQEDDDVHWSMRPAGSPPSTALPPSAALPPARPIAGR